MRKSLKLGCLAAALAVALTAINRLPFPAHAEEGPAAWDTMSDTWALTDALGRTAADYSTAGGISGDKKVGIFYSVWHDSMLQQTAQFDSEAPRNLTEIIRDNPDSWLTDASLYGRPGTMHYWGEPLYGYYNLAKDDWVVRAHAALLAEAGVDYIMLDMTNFFSSGSNNPSETNINTIRNICKVYHEMRAEGQKTPDITCLLTWTSVNAAQAVKWLYENVVQENLDLWFELDGKPLMFCNGDLVVPEIRDVFTFRSVAANYDATNSYQWLSIYPQSYVQDKDGNPLVMTVGVAQNWTDALASFTHVNEYGQFLGRGRSWTSESSRLLTNPIDPEYHSEYGFNFQEQFNRAIEIDPSMLIVTGWNEWIAARFLTSLYDQAAGDSLPNNAQFVDGFTQEFSRDIEMTKEGELKDNFYNQLVENIRLYKGVRKAPDYTQKTEIPDGEVSAFDALASHYRDTIGDNVMRVCDGVANIKFDDRTGRNDIKQAKVSVGGDTAYFYVECSDEITGQGTDNWMRLYISTTGEGGWEGYNYVVNKDAVTGEESKVYRFNGSWNDVAQVGTAKVYVQGKAMYVAVKLADIGVDPADPQFLFKWHDNSQNDGDAMEFYVSGDAAPDARFNYAYTEKTTDANPSGFTDINGKTEYVPMTIRPKNVVAQRFTAAGDFTGVQLTAYNMLNKAATYTVSLYRFKENYAATVAEEPIITKTYTNAYDNTRLYLGAKKIAAGDYLITVTGASSAADNTVGLYYSRETQNGGMYLDGALSAAYALKTQLRYKDLTAANVPAAPSEEEGRKVYTVKLGGTSPVLGLSASAANGVFPSEFEIYASYDGETYQLVFNQSYKNYRATEGEQVFLFDAGNATDIRLVCSGEVQNVTALVPATAKAPETQTGGGCSGGISGALGLSAIAFMAAAATKKRRN